MNSHHRKDGKWSIDKGSIDSVTKKEANEPSRLSSADSFIHYRAYIAGRFKKGNYTKVKPCFDTKSVRFGRTELSLRLSKSSSRDLQSGHGFEACSFKNKRKKLNFHTFGSQGN